MAHNRKSKSQLGLEVVKGSPARTLHDLQLLVRQLDTIEHEQDRDLVQTIADRYGLKRGWE